MANETAQSGGFISDAKPPKFLKTKRSKQAWSYLLESLQKGKLDYSSALTSLALLADKIDIWRGHVDTVYKTGRRYEIDSNGGSLESDESMAERRARSEVLKDLDEAGMTIGAIGKIRAVEQMLAQGDLFTNPLELTELVINEGSVIPDEPPWVMRGYEKKAWTELTLLLTQSGFNFSSAGMSIALIAAAIADWHDCAQWIKENNNMVFATSYETGRTYEVSASYNRVKIARQIRELLKKNGMTVYSCMRNRALHRGRIITPELAEILSFIDQR